MMIMVLSCFMRIFSWIWLLGDIFLILFYFAKIMFDAKRFKFMTLGCVLFWPWALIGNNGKIILEIFE